MTRLKTHIVIICSRLDLPGGTEKAICRNANLFQSNGHQVTLLILDETDHVFFPLHPSVHIQSAPLHFGITERGNRISRKLALWKHSRQLKNMVTALNPQVLIATEYHFAIAMQLAGLHKQCLLFSWEHHHFSELDKNRFWNFLFKKFYPRLDAVVCLNPDEAELFGKIGARTVVIPNYMEQGTLAASGNQQLLTVARFSHVKGIDRLLDVARLVLPQHPQWKWLLIGEGEQHSLVDAALKNDLQNQLQVLPPQGADLSGYYSHSSLYVMTSRHECFPMVLLESMSHGLPCIAFDCETGPRHLISQGISGLLVEDGSIEKMAQALDALITNEDKRREMGSAGYNSLEQFAPNRVYKLWEKLFSGESVRQ